MLHGWPTLEFIRHIEEGMLAEIPRELFLLGQLLHMGPLFAAVWGAGLLFLFQHAERRYRIFAWLFLTVLALLAIRQGKPYYLSPAYPVLFAAGGVWFERWAQRRRTPVPGRVLMTAMVISGLLFVPLATPLLPLATTEKVARTVFGRIVPPRDLLNDFYYQNGWPEHVVAFAEQFHKLPPDEQPNTGILTKTYSIASAVNLYGGEHGLPRAWTGSMTHYFWGPPPEAIQTFLTVQFDEHELQRYFGSVRQVGELHHPLAPDNYHHRPIFLCRAPRQRLSEAWPTFKRFYHKTPAAAQ